MIIEVSHQRIVERDAESVSLHCFVVLSHCAVPLCCLTVPSHCAISLCCFTVIVTLIGGILAPQEPIIDASESCESNAELGKLINTEHCDFVRWRGCRTVRQ